MNKILHIIQENLSSILVAALLLLLVALSLRSLIRKSHGSCSSCCGCPHSATCGEGGSKTPKKPAS